MGVYGPIELKHSDIQVCPILVNASVGLLTCSQLKQHCFLSLLCTGTQETWGHRKQLSAAKQSFISHMKCLLVVSWSQTIHAKVQRPCRKLIISVLPAFAVVIQPYPVTGPRFDKSQGQHILKNPLVLNSVVEKVCLLHIYASCCTVKCLWCRLPWMIW